MDQPINAILAIDNAHSTIDDPGLRINMQQSNNFMPRTPFTFLFHHRKSLMNNINKLSF